jgi:two-component system phosphate regulon sensor histidine kinase PhoR
MSVISALLYLYSIIKNQKQLAIIKDDLISNITHEFKTPIATITSAIEGIAFFNDENDPEKTKRYLEMSGDQLKKLNLMVEKLLETASLDSGEIDLDTTRTNLNELTQQVVDNHQVLMDHKALTLELPSSTCAYEVDPFHIENALSNLIDNANKYGGSKITVQLQTEAGRPIWTVVDSGGAIPKQHRTRIFDKLYRIPTGNQHDVKGFGIGLYYTKSIVEKHGGTVSLDVKPHRTCFTLKL